MTDNPIVYSSEHGKMCSACQKSVRICTCKVDAGQKVVGDGNVRITRSTKGRKGKGVSIISGLPVATSDLKALAKRLKSSLGVGGAVKAGMIEIQSDDRPRIKELLLEEGFKSKIAGG